MKWGEHPSLRGHFPKLLPIPAQSVNTFIVKPNNGYRHFTLGEPYAVDIDTVQTPRQPYIAQPAYAEERISTLAYHGTAPISSNLRWKLPCLSPIS